MSLILFFIILLSFVILLNKYTQDKILSWVYSFGLTIFYINLLLIAISYIFGKIDKNIFSIVTFIFFGTISTLNFNKIRLNLKINKLDKFEVIIIGIISAGIILHIFINLFWGVIHWDTLATYDLRAKFFFYINKITTIVPDEGVYFGVFKYPVLTTNVHLFFYLFKPAVPTIIYSLFIIFFSIGMGKILYILTDNRKYSIIFGTFLFFFNPVIVEHTFISYTNIPFAFFYFFSTIALLLYCKEKQNKWIVLSALFLGISFWLRMEAFAFYAVNIILILFFKKYYRIRNLLTYSFIVLSIGLIWYFVIFLENKSKGVIGYNFFYLGGRGDAINNIKVFQLSNVFQIIKIFFQSISKSEFVFIWYISFFLIFYKWKENLNFNFLFLITAIGLNIIMWVIIWFFAYNENYIPKAGLRTLLNFYPLVFLFVVYKFKKILKI